MPHFFGLGNGKVSAKEEKRIQRIAEDHEAEFVTFQEPNGELRYWFECENKGEPFDLEIKALLKYSAAPAGYPSQWM